MDNPSLSKPSLSTIDMGNSPQKTNKGEDFSNRRRFERIELHLVARFLNANQQEFNASIKEMSAGGAFFLVDYKPQINDLIVAYIDHIGRVEGAVRRVNDEGFSIEFISLPAKREKIIQKLKSLANTDGKLLDKREQERFQYKQNKPVKLVLEDGRQLECRIIDMSLSGAAISLKWRPEINTIVTLGKMRGRIVRHFPEGTAIAFDEKLDNKDMASAI